LMGPMAPPARRQRKAGGQGARDLGRSGPGGLGRGREAHGFLFYLIADDRIVQVLIWHQVQTDEEVAEALRQVKAAGLIPEDQVRLCINADGAPWIWKQVQGLFPSAVEILDYYHCCEHIYKGGNVAMWGPSGAAAGMV